MNQAIIQRARTKASDHTVIKLGGSVLRGPEDAVAILDIGHVAQGHRGSGQDGRRYAGEGRVLVAARSYAALYGDAAFDEVLVHGSTL